MKKILAIFMCIFLICAFPVAAFAEEETLPSDQTEVVAETFPTITTEMILEWGKEHFEEISVVVSLIVSAFYSIRKYKKVNGAIATSNKNAIKIASDSDTALQDALTKMASIASEVSAYKEAFEKLLEEFRVSAEDKQKLEKTLNEAMNCIKASKLANVEFADELAQLLVLANIPNSKKDELYSRHIAAKKVIADAEKTEVNTDDGGKET